MTRPHRLIDRPDTPTALYRYFDERDRLLYVGITGDLADREQGHIRASQWSQLVARSAVGRYPNRREALKAERIAIETERPLFNRQYNDTPEARRRLRVYLEEIGRADMLSARKYASMPPGELEMAQLAISQKAADLSHERGPCEEDARAEYDYRVEVDHALTSSGRPVCQRGVVILHTFDGRECAEVYLYASEARDLARALADHADESLAPEVPSKPAVPPSAVTQLKRRVS